MPVPVVQIRVMRMGVTHRFMPVPVRMRLRNRPVMRMLVMFVVHMAVFVFQRLMLVRMLVPFRQM